VNPSNLVEPLKVNEFKSHYDPWQLKSIAFAKTAGEIPGSAAELQRRVEGMNPTLFATDTPAQRSDALIQELVYHGEHDRIDSMHNSLANPN